MTGVIGKATRMGWKRYKKGDKFEVVIQLDYAPGWPIDVVWRGTPIMLDLTDSPAVPLQEKQP
jgi:hypothetical protein